jgi:hypothetical protein
MAIFPVIRLIRAVRFVRLTFVTAVVCLFSGADSFGQLNRPVQDTIRTPGIRYQVELSGLAASNSRTPFWLRSNQFGTVPLESPSAIVSAAANGLWGNPAQNRKPYVKAGVELVGNVNRSSRFVLPQAYAAVHLGHGELYIGRRKEINGITDTLLTSGSYALSGNAVPITQIRIGTKDYAPLKFTRGVISVNAFFSHGWFSNTDSIKNSYLHAKALFVRIGKPEWKIRLYGGMTHYVQWGGHSNYLGPYFANEGKLASGWEAFKLAIWPRSETKGGSLTNYDTLNRTGNHLGSTDFAFDIRLKKSSLLFYMQHPWEDMSGIVFANFPDGIYGARWQNTETNRSAGFQLRALTLEYATTRNQSGPTMPKGYDEYFVNFQYLDGWTHQRRVLGTPFFTRYMDSAPAYRNKIAPKSFKSMINNNSIELIHVGVVGRFRSGVTVATLLSQSWNYGHPYERGFSSAVKQFSGLLEVTIPNLAALNGVSCKASIAYDKGDWLPSGFGGMLTILKRGWF